MIKIKKWGSENKIIKTTMRNIYNITLKNLYAYFALCIILILILLAIQTISFFEEKPVDKVVEKEVAVEVIAVEIKEVVVGETLVGTTTPTPITREFAFSSAGAYAIDGNSLYKFRTEKRWPIASITKLITALVAYENLELSRVIKITEEAIATEGGAGKFSAGGKYTLDDLVKAAILVSSNDATEAIAIYYGRDDFIALMNKKVKEIGMTNTSLVDPTGLSIQNLSSVEDLYKLSKYILLNEPRIFDISTKEVKIITEITSNLNRPLKNINFFAGHTGFLGGKTGRIPESNGNLLSVFNLPKKKSEVIIIVLGADDRFLETEKILNDL